MKLVDTSAWIEQLRTDGDALVRERVEALLLSGEAAWCPLVRLELWNGARGAAEKKVLVEMAAELPDLEILPAVWDRACVMAANARAKGITVPSSDLLVAACAVHHQVQVVHNDAHFDLIAKIV